MRGVSGDDPEGGAGSGVLRLRLVTAGSGGPGHRPPGIRTWLRGARCTDPEAMPEMEARPPAKNRHGGAPRGARPSVEGRQGASQAPGLPPRTRVSQDARGRADGRPLRVPLHPCACRRSARPSSGRVRRGNTNPDAEMRRGERDMLRSTTLRSGLFDIVKKERGVRAVPRRRLQSCVRTHTYLEAARCGTGGRSPRTYRRRRLFGRMTLPKSLQLFGIMLRLDDGDGQHTQR
jgi:hypothetical protein